MHAHVYSAGLPALLLGRLARAPVVVTEHYTGFQRGIVTGYERLLARLAFERADLVAPVSDGAGGPPACSSRPVRASACCPNVVDTDAFTPPRRRATAAAGARLLTVGALAEKKGHRYLLDALAQLSDGPADRAGRGGRRRAARATWRPAPRELGLADARALPWRAAKGGGGAADARRRPVRAAQPPRDVRVRADRGDGERAAVGGHPRRRGAGGARPARRASWSPPRDPQALAAAIERGLERPATPPPSRAAPPSATATTPLPSGGPRSTRSCCRAAAGAPPPPHPAQRLVAVGREQLARPARRSARARRRRARIRPAGRPASACGGPLGRHELGRQPPRQRQRRVRARGRDRDQRRAGRQRLHLRQAPVLEARGVHEHAGGRHERQPALAVDVAEPLHPGRLRASRARASQRRPAAAVEAADRELARRAARPRATRHTAGRGRACRGWPRRPRRRCGPRRLAAAPRRGGNRRRQHHGGRRCRAEQRRGAPPRGLAPRQQQGRAAQHGALAPPLPGAAGAGRLSAAIPSKRTAAGARAGCSSAAVTDE